MQYSFATHPNAAEVLKVPGYLFWNPSSLANEAGWGTKIGFCEKGIKVEIDYKVVNLVEEFSSEWRFRVFVGSNVRVSAALKNWNATALSLLFPGQSLSSPPRVTVPGVVLPGSSLLVSQYSKTLLFVPDNLASPIFILQKASPAFSKEFVLSRIDDLIFYCVFDGFRKTDHADGLFYFGSLNNGVLR